MLIEFRVENFRSFKDEQVFSLVASKDKAHPENLIKVDGCNLLKAAALYGQNASGKSNLISAFKCMKSFVSASATTMTKGDAIPNIRCFRLDPKLANKPSMFAVTVVIGDTRFEYGFCAGRERVHEEWLVARPPGKRRRQQRWLERKYDSRAKQTRWHFRGPLRRDARLLRDRTRENGLVLSRAAELNIEPLTDLFLWFRMNLWVLDMSDAPTHLFAATAKRALQDKHLLDQITRMVQSADLGIHDISVAEKMVLLQDFPKELADLLRRKNAKDENGDSITGVAVLTEHRVPGKGRAAKFDLPTEESNGTNRFFALCGPFLEAVREGAIIVVDELDCSMHPLLVRKLIELFQSPKVNKRGAQLVFATHDSTLMDPELFRRDQIWLIEKNSEQASELFSLYDFDPKDRPRNTEAFQRNYLAGRYGGVPRFGPVFEDLEIG